MAQILTTRGTVPLADGAGEERLLPVGRSTGGQLVRQRVGLPSGAFFGIWGGLPGGVDDQGVGGVAEESGEASLATSVLQGWPLKLREHVVDTGCLPMTAHDPTGSSSLDGFQLVGVFGGIRVPDGAGILQLGSNECEEGALLDVLGADFEVTPEEAKGLVGLVRDVGDVGVPAEVVGDGDAKVFYLLDVSEGVAT